MNNLFDNESIKAKIKAWADGIVGEVKSVFGITDESSVMRDEVGAYLAKGMASGLEKNNKAVVKQFRQMLTNLKYERDMDIISEEEYYTELENLRDKYFSVGTENWVKYTAQIYKYQQKALKQEQKQIEELYDDLSEYVEKKLGEVVEKQQKMERNLRNSSPLFKKNTIKVDDFSRTFYTMNDMSTDIEHLEHYAKYLKVFSEKADRLNVPEATAKAFLAEINSFDFDKAFAVLNSVLENTDGNFLSYISKWETKNKLAEDISQYFYKDDLENALNVSEMEEIIEKAGYDLPKKFFRSGTASAESFGDAFLAELENQMEKIRSRFADYSAKLNEFVGTAGNTYNTLNTTYNINENNGGDTVESIKRYETLKRLSGVSGGGGNV